MTLQKPPTRPNANLQNRLKIYSYKIVTNILAKKLNDPIQAEKSKLREKFWGFRMTSNTHSRAIPRIEYSRSFYKHTSNQSSK